jgi:hypothetical protein
MANGYTHAARESTPGNELNTPTLSTKVIYEPVRSISVALNPKPMERDDEVRNVDEPLAVLAEMYDPTWELESRAYPDLLGFELATMLGNPTTTAGDGVITDPDAATIPAGATRHVFTAPYLPAGLNPKTAQRQLCYVDQGVFYKAKGCGTNSLSIDTPVSGGVSLKASGPALYLARIADPALTPAYEALTVAPFERAHCTLSTWLGSTGETDDVTVAMAQAMDAAHTLGSTSKFPDQLERGDGPGVIVTGSIPKRQIAAADYDALLAATGFAVKIRWQSTVVIGATAYKYTLWFEALNAQYMDGGPEALANKRRHGGSFNWKATYAGAAGSSKWTLVNATASYV